MNVMEVMKTRRSVRKFKADPVGDDALNTVLDAARWAPSWANTQCCRLVVVKDPENKAKLADALTPTNPAANAVRTAPVVIVACAVLGRSGFKRGEVMTSKGDWFMFDVALAMQNLTLAAWELGLGTVHVGLFDAKKVEEALQVPDGVTVVSMTPLGYPDEEPKAPARKELSEIVFRERYGQA
ncbi:MAG: nitroreductase family protein [Chloroflexota bacterium]|nr:nitroreductase family protein [Chloroflexota bacterium]